MDDLGLSPPLPSLAASRQVPGEAYNSGSGLFWCNWCTDVYIRCTCGYILRMAIRFQIIEFRCSEQLKKWPGMANLEEDETRNEVPWSQNQGGNARSFRFGGPERVVMVARLKRGRLTCKAELPVLENHLARNGKPGKMKDHEESWRNGVDLSPVITDLLCMVLWGSGFRHRVFILRFPV